MLSSCSLPPSSMYFLLSLLFIIFRTPPSSTLFPYTTLFRSGIIPQRASAKPSAAVSRLVSPARPSARPRDRKSTRLNSSHSQISYAVFCLKKKNHHQPDQPHQLRPHAYSNIVTIVDTATTRW